MPLFFIPKEYKHPLTVRDGIKKQCCKKGHILINLNRWWEDSVLFTSPFIRLESNYSQCVVLASPGSLLKCKFLNTTTSLLSQKHYGWDLEVCFNKFSRWFWGWCRLKNRCFKAVTRRVTAAAAESLQSCPPVCHPIVGSPPGSPVPGVLQARVLEWVAIAFSTELSLEKVNPKIMITLLLC